MKLPWEVWWGVAAMALGIAALMVYGVRRIQAAQRNNWLAVLLCAVSVLISTALSALSFWQSHETLDFARTLQNPAPPAYLAPDWGLHFSAEERSKHSQTVARTTFVNWGIHVNYFDLDGSFRQYQSTDEDRSHRASQLRYRERTGATGSLLFWLALGWIIVPWLALAYGVAPWFRQRSGALTLRSNADAPPLGGAPLS